MITRKASHLARTMFGANDPATEQALSASATEKRRRLAAEWNIQNLKGKQRRGAKRAIEAIVRRPKTYNKDNRKLSQSDLLFLQRKYRPSALLDQIYCDRGNPGRWLPIAQRNNIETRIIDLENFSFLKDPAGTMKGLQEILKAECECLDVRINFKDSHCLDVTPFMVLVEAWGDMIPIFSGGEMDLPMQKVLSAVGFEKALNVTFAGISTYSDVWAFPLMRRRNPGASASNHIYSDVPTRDIAADRFCDAINEWLGTPEILLELTEAGRGKIKTVLIEVLENAERHSDGIRRDGSWSISGFLARREEADGTHVYRACIGILSVGDTFSDSLNRALPDQRREIEGYTESIRAKGAKQSVPTLRTLAALQDGVTCVPEADRDGRGGVGLMEMLDLVSLLGQTDSPLRRPEVSIISGASCIHLKTPYEKGMLEQDASGAIRLQWFNEENSARVPPDDKHVFDLEHFLPGTAISISFTLDTAYLRNF